MIPTLANHLLQSTVFALVAGSLTLFLRNNHARTRYWVWLAASMKFLIPLSRFVELGHRLSWQSAALITQPQLAYVMSEVSQPFASSVVASGVAASAPSMAPMILTGVWACGCAAVLIFWFVRWRRVAAIVRAGAAWDAGRDVGVEVIVSPTQMEPGVFGVFRPVLCLPAGIADHLNNAQLDAVFAHELCHVRYRDNLAAAVHMVVEAMLWFHPLVWFIGARLVEERERACDEDVVRLGGEPEIYAESILKICRLYLESPLVCAAGISGSNLGKRIEGIMSYPLVTRLSVGKRLLLTAAGSFALVVPIAAGMFAVHEVRAQLRATPPPKPIETAPSPVVTAQATPPPPVRAVPVPSAPAKPPKPPVFEVASIRENPGPWHVRMGYTASGPRLTLESWVVSELIAEAYGLKGYRVIIPDSLRSVVGTVYDTMAKAEGDGAPTRIEFRQMLQAMLADRFRLTAHREMREMPVYAMVIGKNGIKFKESAPDELPKQFHGVYGRNQSIELVQGTMDVLAEGIPRSLFIDRPVVDETGLTGKYDIKLEATPEFRINNNPQPGDVSTFTAIEEQLGLKLEATKTPIEVLVVDHLEKPSEN